MSLLLAALLAGAATPPTPAPLAPPKGHRLVWSDEFSGKGLPDPRTWDWDTEFNKRGWHNKELQYYAARRLKNARVGQGLLTIEAHREKLDRLPDWGGQRYSSARLVTRGRAAWTYGFFEVRAKIPCGVGTWPAIWTLSAKEGRKWPDDGEIDIMEHVGHDEGVIHQTVHTGAFNHVLNTHKAGQATLPDACGAFHRYQLDWDAQRIRMGIDGREVFRFDRTRGAGRAEWPFDAPQYLILNIAVGGTWGGAKGVDEASFPARMEVDYVRVWQRGKAR